MQNNSPVEAKDVVQEARELLPPDIKAAIRKLQDAAWNCGTDEYRDGVSDAACTRRYDAMVQARADCVAAADALTAKVATLTKELADIRECDKCDLCEDHHD